MASTATNRLREDIRNHEKNHETVIAYDAVPKDHFYMYRQSLQLYRTDLYNANSLAWPYQQTSTLLNEKGDLRYLQPFGGTLIAKICMV